MSSDESAVLEDGPLIWVLDDDVLALKLLGDVLAQGGYNYHCFSDDADMFECLAQGERPALVLLDWMLGGRSGYEVLKEWVDCASDVPVVVITALSGESVLLNAFKLGAADVVRKPFDVTELLARVRHQLNYSAQTSLEHVVARRQRLLLRCARELLAAQSASVCWDVVEACVHEELGGEIYCREQEDLVRWQGASDARLELSGLQREWRKLLHGERIWLGLDVLGKVHRHEPEVKYADQGCWVQPMLLGGQLLGVMCWPGDGALDDGVVEFVEELRDLSVEAQRRHVLEHTEVDADLLWVHAPGRAFLDRIIEASPDAVVAADRKGRIILMNSAAERVLEWPRDSALGQDVSILYQDGVARQIMTRLRSDDEGGYGKLSRHREILLARDGQEIPVELSAALLVQGDQELGSVSLFKDLRERIDMEGRLEQVTQDLESQREKVVMAQMAGATAHELNQPLTSMLNYLEYLKQGQQDPERADPVRTKKALAILERDALRIAEIVRQVAQITQYRTRPYVDDMHILDLSASDD